MTPQRICKNVVLGDEQALLSSALTSIATAIFITDADGCIIWANEAFCTLCGYAKSEVLGQRPSLLRSGQHGAQFYMRMWHTIQAGKTWQAEVVDRRKDGSLYTVAEIITPLFATSGEITHFIAIQHDITDSKRESEQHKALAYHDSLTGLPNRLQFLDSLDDAVARHGKQGKRFALMFVDLDRFKPVNDTWGHHVGDMLLIAVAKRIRTAMRRTDVLARLSGDEFTVIENRLLSHEDAAQLAGKLIATLNKPFRLDGHLITIGASVGIAVFPDDGSTSDTLLKCADTAMYRAKAAGRNCYRFYAGVPIGRV
ncbi:MAG: sensor domain-containing diguanylate cyclase [Burkholderiales bacterium]|nr:sensor domain-containing diguanylate cyclase [Burkholderiales bacterium]